ncbi:MAG TPA: hypothetical protein VFV37_07725 [Luteibaculaceae bacterium]|nr:hypothetical protein [Luteibaculaceae bacterium]
MKKITVALLLAFATANAYAQQYTTVFGLQYKPIVPSAFFRNDGFAKLDELHDINLKASTGSSLGAVVRRGISKRFSVEGGINMVNRNYNLTVRSLDTNQTFEQNFKWLSYEIPIQTMVFVQLGTKTYLNAAAGASFNFFPSDIEGQNDFFYQRTFRQGWLRTALTANLGFEYRTESSGFLYLGASYMQPFSSMAQTTVFQRDNLKNFSTESFRGNYLTIDLRYYFHADPNPVTKSKLRKYRKQKKKASQP